MGPTAAITRATATTVMCLLVVATSVSASRAEDRFSAQWVDGTRSSAADLDDWGFAKADPKIAKRAIFDRANPARWVRDNLQAATAPPDAFVEFIGGDCLPGQVTGYRAAGDVGAPPAPPHLLVSTSVQADVRGFSAKSQVRVVVDGLRRVVWQRRENQTYRPGTVFLRSGSQIGFRSLRWSDAGLRLLLEEGTGELAFDDIAELHLPATDSWEAVFRRLAALSPTCEARLMRVEGQGGLKLTTSQERFQAKSIGGSGSPSAWIHVSQPVWSLDPLAILHRKIYLRTFFAAQEVPLSWIEPSRSEHHAQLAGGWREYKVDASVQNGPLRSGGRSYAWGFGVHGSHELDFRLPACAKSFRVGLGLDEAVGVGGCARGRILVGAAHPKTIYTSPLLVGSAKQVDSGPLSLESASIERLSLVSDAAIHEHPSGADPLDIRDVVDWLEPIVELDARQLQVEVDKRGPSAIPALAGWTIDGACGSAWRPANYLDTGERMTQQFRPLMQLLGGQVSLAKKFKIAHGQDAAKLFVSHRESRGSGRMQMDVLVDGQPLPQPSLPSMRFGEAQAIVVVLSEYVNREVTLEVRFTPTDTSALIDWRGVTFFDASTLPKKNKK